MLRLKFIIAYEGTRYAGWQLQAGSKPTVQGEVERALAAVIGGRCPLHVAGRTDAGVHAEAQVCHVDLPPEQEHRLCRVHWQRALNVRLPEDIRILSVEPAPPGFHARRSAVAKDYAYSFWLESRGKNAMPAPPRLRPFVWSLPPLDLERLEAALPFFIGRRDFSSFQNIGSSQPDTIRVLRGITLLPDRCGPLAGPPGWPLLTLLFHGESFLKQMVRNLTGALAWIGLGKLAAEDLPAVFAAADRTALPSPSAPARGLTLLRVYYPGEVPDAGAAPPGR